LKVALLVTDEREPFKKYDMTEPYFLPAPESLLQGFVNLPGLELHIVSCIQERPRSSPAKLAENIWFHTVHVPKLGWMRTLYQGCVRGVRRKLKEIRPDIVHAQGTERECAISAVLSGFPNVLTLHGVMRAQAQLWKSKWPAPQKLIQTL